MVRDADHRPLGCVADSATARDVMVRILTDAEAEAIRRIVPNRDITEQPIAVLRHIYGDPPPIATAPTRPAVVKTPDDFAWPLGDPSKYLPKNHDFVCLKCGKELDKGEKFCPGCGKKNPGYLPEADKKIPMNKKSLKQLRKDKRAEKRIYQQSRSELWAFAADAQPSGAIKSRSDAERYMMESARYDPDPAVRLAADAILKKAQ